MKIVYTNRPTSICQNNDLLIPELKIHWWLIDNKSRTYVLTLVSVGLLSLSFGKSKLISFLAKIEHTLKQG